MPRGILIVELYVRHNMSIKLRYSLLVIGCLVHAAFVAVNLNKPPFTISEHQPPFSPPFGWLIWMALLCIWPAWSLFFWKYGIKKKGAVIIPILAGLAIMWRVLGELSIVFIMICFPNAVHM